MKNKIQKIFRMMLALALLLTSIGLNNAFAENSGSTTVNETAGKGSITVNGATVGKSYAVYKIFDLTYEGENVSYTIAKEWKDFFATGDGREYIVDRNNISNSLNPIAVDGKTKYMNITEENKEAFAKAAMGEMHKMTATQVQKASDTTLTFNNLALGYYLVHPEGASEAAKGQSSIVSLTSTVPNGVVNVKGTYPTIKKEANSKSADYGGTISFTITGKVPDPTGYKKYEYVIKDTLPTGLTIDPNSINVTIAGTKQTANITSKVEKQNLTVTLDILELIKGNTVKAGDEIKVTYKTTVNKDFNLGNQGQVNKAYVEFPNDPKNVDSKDKTPEEKVTVYSGKIKVIKHAKNITTERLEGAKFALKNDKEKYYKLEETDGVKRVSWVDSLDKATVLTSNKNGELEFTGIKAGTYKLKETKAPKGYNLLTDDVEVVLRDEDKNTTEKIEMEATSKIANSSGVELPKVGGAGTKLFALIGGAVILYAALSLVRRKIKLQER
ncbi:SpaH/EbpB family LPXTG-anchored major pilin [Peptostreptococcus anaerobius]|uniref:SpaH/EbpB family LPXTG-anchored major pilin n=1 Tax=Peptostreptococcus anaerobius TaxID=1261 RepID=UPI0029016007|nr:SpaH/EbpB family LPXTG-anchored major pilin [Peptostreptococcus anaerobius]MDU0998583.1 SpaH/EbpB family LPXTG-anchored major pilin [Peptostreptococcus anaerobius]